MQTKYCNTCRFADSMQHVCQILRMKIDPGKDFCSKHSSTMQVCEYCGKHAINTIVIPDGDIWHILCNECAIPLSSCRFCKKASSCAFETDPSPIPKLIQQQVRNGPMISVVTVKNPARIDITCKKNCPCYDPEFECMKQFNYCKKMEYVYTESRLDDTREPAIPADNTGLHI